MRGSRSVLDGPGSCVFSLATDPWESKGPSCQAFFNDLVICELPMAPSISISSPSKHFFQHVSQFLNQTTSLPGLSIFSFNLGSLPLLCTGSRRFAVNGASLSGRCWLIEG